ncbi:MAG: GNAT family N-acetyltransferase [Oscillospiraceae bacterium]|nr:GNAT family N-acetyltransferase [Oscillospiraceae bacterium]MBQ6700072.1 GNAT family N-acetyltransferase [Oscillospiraceae bacterium]MBQ6802231.1 GNAT family N-acetyltransferase [Oscillospiraceae bacterium]
MSYHREAQYMANMIEIVKADPAKKEDYKRIFDNSPLYNHYFKNTDFLDKVLSEALKAGQAYVAVDRNGEAVGYMSMKASDEMVDGLPCLTLLGVKDTKRGRGIGQMLIAFYVGVMSGLGFGECALVVNDWNPRARKLYDSLGFKLRRSYEDKVIGGWMNHILVKKL